MVWSKDSLIFQLDTVEQEQEDEKEKEDEQGDSQGKKQE